MTIGADGLGGKGPFRAPSPVAILLTALVAATPSSLRAADPPAAASVVARVGERTVTLEDLRRYLETLDPAVREKLAGDPALLNRTVRTYAARVAVLEEARSAGWHREPEIAALLERVQEETIVATYLRNRAAPPEDYPSEADIQAFYEQNQPQFVLPRQYKVAQVFIASPDPADKAAAEVARKRLDDVSAQVRKKGADFLAIAREKSDEKTVAADAESLAWVPETVLLPAIRGVVAGMQKNGVSEPVKLDDGWHILKLYDTKAASVRPLEEARPAIVASLRRKRQQELEARYLSEVLVRNPPAINELALPAIIDKK